MRRQQVLQLGQLTYHGTISYRAGVRAYALERYARPSHQLQERRQEIRLGVKAVLSFNEPEGKRDAGGGSGVPAAIAAKVHIDVFNGLDGVEIGAPGTTQRG